MEMTYAMVDDFFVLQCNRVEFDIYLIVYLGCIFPD
jgi:hypothetical protein